MSPNSILWAHWLLLVASFLSRGGSQLVEIRTSSVGLLGTPIVAHYDLRQVPAQQRLGKSYFGSQFRDWVGLYREGECDHNEPVSHIRHKCSFSGFMYHLGRPLAP